MDRGKVERAASQNRLEQAAQEVRYQDTSKKRLLKILKKKLSTSFIGALAAFEEFFGEVWGHGLDDSEKSERQLAAGDLWEECRTQVLNNGNTQSRAVEAELSQYTVSWNRHQMVLRTNNER